MKISISYQLLENNVLVIDEIIPAIKTDNELKYKEKEFLCTLKYDVFNIKITRVGTYKTYMFISNSDSYYEIITNEGNVKIPLINTKFIIQKDFINIKYCVEDSGSFEIKIKLLAKSTLM